MNVQLAFGGQTVVFGDNFRQILQVVRDGNRTSIVEIDVKNSFLSPIIVKGRLIQNMRVQNDTEFNK